MGWGIIGGMDETYDPQQSHDEDNTPFVGREAIYARLHQLILDPPDRHAITFVGHDGVGKSALLRQFRHVFGDQLLGVYFPSKTLQATDEAQWLQHIVTQTNHLLTDHNFSLSRLPDEHDPTQSTYRDWIQDVYLPQIFQIIRAQRRLVWLFDDAEALFNLPDDHVIYLHRLLHAFDQLAIVLALDTEYDRQLERLAPLVTPTRIDRIHRLDQTQSATLIRQLAPTVNDDAIARVYRLTGGHPRLLQRFGQQLNTIWAEDVANPVQQATPQVYQASQDEFKTLWQQLSRDERMVLTAIASLIYTDATRPVTPRRIATWLIETEYPIDLVAINAALRGLDYRDIVRNQPSAEVTLLTGLMQTWLLDHARLEAETAPTSAVNRWVVALVLAGIMLAVLLIWQLPSPTRIAPDAQPTVTLSQP